MGYVYAFSNESMPGIFKIGMTERTPEKRLTEANGSDEFKPPLPYVIAIHKKVKKLKKRFMHYFLIKESIHIENSLKLQLKN